MVPFRSFSDPSITANPNIEVIAPQYGGHCAFVARGSGDERFWVEPRIVETCRQRSTLLGS